MPRPDRGGDDVAAREARSVLARTRADHSDGAERFTDLYVWVFCGVMGVVWVLSFARETFTGEVCSVGAGAGCAVQQLPVPAAVAVALLGWGLLLRAAGAVGPVSADRAAARWLLGTTAERAVLLRGPWGAAVATTASGGAVVGLLTALAAGGGGVDVVPLVVGGLLGALAGGLSAVGLVLAQTSAPVSTSPTETPLRRTGVLLALLGLALLTGVVVRGEALPEVDPQAPGAWSPWLVLLLAVVPAALLAVAWAALARPGSRLAEVSDAQLRRGREVVDAVSQSTMMLDSSMIVGLQRRRADQRGGRHRSRPLRGRGAFAFLVADLRLVRRRWRSVGLTAVGLPAVLVAGEGFGYGGAVLLASVLASWAGRQAGQGLRTWLGSAGLRRSVTVPARQVVLALTVLPALAATCVAVPAVLLVEGPWWGGVHLALAGLAATMRSADPVPTEVGALLTTPAGALPTGLLHQAMHGPDVALVLALTFVLVGEPWVLTAAVLALAWQVTRDR